MPDELASAFDKKQLTNLLNAYKTDSKHRGNDGLIWGIYALAKWHELHRKSPIL